MQSFQETQLHYLDVLVCLNVFQKSGFSLQLQ